MKKKFGYKSVQILANIWSKRFKNAIYMILEGIQSYFQTRFVDKAISLSFLKQKYIKIHNVQ